MTALVTLENVSMRFALESDSQHSVFNGVTLSLNAGERLGLLGRNGSGKSTLLRLLAGLDTHVEFTGTIETSDGLALAGRVSYMAQSDLLMPWATILDNVGLGGRLRGEKEAKEQGG